MDRFIGNLIFFAWWAIVILPSRLLALLALAWLGVVLWLHRRRQSRRGVTGADAAGAILAARGLETRVVAVWGTLADGYLPGTDTIVLSERTFHGTSVGALSIAAHEAGHALQRSRWFLPWCIRGLLVLPAGLGLVLCLWIWLLGIALDDQRVLMAAAGSFGAYLLFLLFELWCEVDASRRGVRELVRHGLLDATEARIARRILRSALLTYIAFFAGTTLAMAFFLSALDWPTLIDHLSVARQQLGTIFSHG